MRLFGRQIHIPFISRRSADPTTALSNPRKWFLEAVGATNGANVPVNEDTALSLSAFFAAINTISQNIASLPLHVVELDGNGNRTIIYNHPLAQVLREPSPMYTGYNFRRAMQAIAMLRGNAFALILRDGAGRVRGMEILDNKNVTVLLVQSELGHEVWYDIKGLRADGEPMRVPGTEVLHIQGFSLDGIVGQPVWRLGRENFAMALAAQKYEASFFGNGAHVSGYLKYPSKLTKEQKEMIAESWRRKYAGVDNVNVTPVLEGGMEYVRTGLSPQEALLGDAKKLAVEDISRWLNVPLYKLQQLDRATFNNIEVMARDFINQSLRPVAELWEAELRRKLLRERDRNRFDFRHDFSEMLRADSERLAQMIATLFDKGVISINDGRRIMGMNVLDEPWANKHYVQLNMSPADGSAPASEPPAQEDAPVRGVKVNGYNHVTI